MIGLTKKSPTFSKKSALKRGRRQQRTVAFSRNDNEAETVTIRTIPALSDFTLEEKQNSWYTETEFKIMKLEVMLQSIPERIDQINKVEPLETY